MLFTRQGNIEQSTVTTRHHVPSLRSVPASGNMAVGRSYRHQGREGHVRFGSSIRNFCNFILICAEKISLRREDEKQADTNTHRCRDT
jgi:hypothetical protein